MAGVLAYSLAKSLVGSKEKNELFDLKLETQSGISSDNESVEQLGVATHVVDDALKSTTVGEEILFDLVSNKLSSSILDFLARPQIVRYGTFDSADVGCWFLPTSIMADFLSASNVALKKIDGFFGMKYTMCIKLFVNAEKFQQGRLILGVVPTGGYTQNNAGFYMNFHCAAVENRIQCLHEELDLGTQTEITVKIPWNQASTLASIQHYLNNSTPQIGDCGYYFISNYLPFRTGSSGSTDATYSVFMWMEDVELFGLTTQSGLTNVRRDVASNLATENSGHNDVLSATGNTTIARSSDSSIKEILKKPTLMSTFDWTINYSANSYLVEIPVTPGTAFTHSETSSGHTVNFITLTPMAFMTNLFAFWRGDIRVVFKISKTTFHSGRLAILFVPSSKGVTAPTMNTNKDMAFQRVIWDIRECNSIEFVVPYTSISPWTHTGDTIGKLVVEILNPLVCPATVSTTVDLVCEYYGTDSTEFAVPVRQYFRPYRPLTIQSGLTKVETNMDTDDYIHVNSETHKVVDLGVSNQYNVSFGKHCIGENIIDLRTLVRRYVPFDNIEPQTATGCLINYQPFQLNVNWLTSGGYWDISNGIPSSIDLIVTAFCLFGGSMDFKLLSENVSFEDVATHQRFSNKMHGVVFRTDPTVVGWTSHPVKGFVDTNVTTGTWLANVANASIAYSRPDINGGIEIRVPQYHYDPYRAALAHFTTGSTGMTRGLGCTATSIQFKIEGMETAQVYKRVAPDFVLKNFVSFGAYATTASS